MPPLPDGALPYLNWDLSPVRPWEWWQIEAGDWIEAQAVRAAVNEGIEDARDEMAAARELARDET